MVFLIKENGVKNILFHISILPSVEQKANAWNYRQYRILLAQKLIELIEPFTIRKAEQVRSALSYVKKRIGSFSIMRKGPILFAFEWAARLQPVNNFPNSDKAMLGRR